VADADAIAYTARERNALWLVAATGLCGLNGIFVYALVFRRDAITAALTNPVSFAFIAEALLMTGVLAYLLRKWNVSRLSWAWFVALALLGGLACAVPVAALWKASRTP
jgi:hypothetical protein